MRPGCRRAEARSCRGILAVVAGSGRRFGLNKTALVPNHPSRGALLPRLERATAMTGSAERTNPKLWNEVKTKVTDGSKGGKPGQWSARKAQLAVSEYK